MKSEKHYRKMEIEIKDNRVLVRASNGTAIIEDKGRKITVIGVWSNDELRALVNTVRKVREKSTNKGGN